jgi:tRNA splicing endonuclease
MRQALHDVDLVVKDGRMDGVFHDLVHDGLVVVDGFKYAAELTASQPVPRATEPLVLDLHRRGFLIKNFYFLHRLQELALYLPGSTPTSSG